MRRAVYDPLVWFVGSVVHADRMSVRPLLTLPGYYGTLAAARYLGRAGIPVSIADGSRFSISSCSRYVRERLTCPAMSDGEQLIHWLVSLGRGEKRYTLLPTSDDSAWLYSRFREELSRHFFVLAAPHEGVYSLLNKRLLHDHCVACGVAVPQTWFPQSASELAAQANGLPFPLMVKPRTQVLYASRHKGAKVSSEPELLRVFRSVQASAHSESLRKYDPDVDNPIVQEFFPDAAEQIYNLSGFVAGDGQISSMRASIKVLQYPRSIGIGLCFEEAPVDEEAAAAIGRLVSRTGFVGIFEAEFISVGARKLLIDFNPRFYNQMVFDMDRGLALAELAYFEALGDRQRVQELMAKAQAVPAGPPRVYTHRLLLEAILRLQGLSGALSPQESCRWRSWLDEHRGTISDAVRAADDPRPGYVDTTNYLRSWLLHPRSTLRRLVFNRSE